jgi:hypothetical protein
MTSQDSLKGFPLIKTQAAGIDIGGEFHMVAIPEWLSDNPVRKFLACSEGLRDLAMFLKEHDITEAAMEATGIYWVPLFNLLEEQGIKPVLLDPKSLKGLPGRKSDVLDCQWILKAYSHDLGSACFVPDAETAELRELVRGRSTVDRDVSRVTNRMIRDLRLMNINLEIAVTDVQGETGMRIISAIVDGERDPHKLAAMKDPRCKNSEEEIVRHLDGVYTKSHLLNLAYNFNTYKHLMKTIRSYNEDILSFLRKIPTSSKYSKKNNGYKPQCLRDLVKGKSQTMYERTVDKLFIQEGHRILGVDLKKLKA